MKLKQQKKKKAVKDLQKSLARANFESGGEGGIWYFSFTTVKYFIDWCHDNSC